MKKKTSIVKGQMSAETYNYQKRIDPLQDKYPRWKGFHCSSNKKHRIEVENVLLPWMSEFVKINLKWKKLPKLHHNDSRASLTQYFIGKHYPGTVWRGGKQVKKNNWYKPNVGGKLIIDIIKTEQPGFAESEILDTLIQVIYKNRIDHFSIKVKPFKNTMPVKEHAISIWNRISEKVQV